jgi:pyridoxal phosphate enzyme (YggS family)
MVTSFTKANKLTKFSDMPSIAENLALIKVNIEQAIAISCAHQTVKLVAVSKTQTSAALREAYAAGQTAFGENYLQEAINKQNELSDLNIEWHFIGPIQSNKTQLIAQHFEWVHGVDRLKIAQRLNDARINSKPLQICLQVNISDELTKSGISPELLSALAKEVSQLPNLKLRGLMTIPEPTSDIETQRSQLTKMRELLNHLNQQGHQLDTLSMGMSNDYMIAIEEGATIVRIGSAIFGARPPKH